ncbi:MAG: tripartite tricarboxylate transporter TctB family protein [Geminicoccaceae bacterium]|jgi:putative tricarboxylic transport membrane protein
MTTGWGLRIGEAVLGGVVLGLGLFIAIETSLLEVAPSNAAIGPRLFPSLIAFGLLAVGVAVLWQAFFGHVAHERGFELDWRAVALVSAGLLLQMFLVESLGWIIATALLFTATSLAFAERRLVVTVLIGLALSGLTFAIFNYGLGLTLPIGTAIEKLLPATDDEAE